MQTRTEEPFASRHPLPPFELASRLVEIEHRHYDLVLAIADAEERGDWPLAAQLRGRRRLDGAAVRRGPPRGGEPAGEGSLRR